MSIGEDAKIPILSTEVKRLLLPKKQIIASRKEIRFILDNGGNWSCRYFKARFLPSISPQNRFAILVSKRIGGAVQRNRTKRIFREAIRIRQVLFTTHMDFLFLPATAKCTLKEIECSIVQLSGEYRKLLH